MKRDPKAKAGELRAAWSEKREHGTSEFGERGDLCVAYGGRGATRADMALLMNALTGARWRPPLAVESFGGPESDPSLLEELHRRGYDLSTLRFSIRKRTPTEPPADG